MHAMFRQFWTDCAVIFGLAFLAFAGFTLPDWAILSPELASDAIPLSIVAFINDYGAFLLAFAAFRTGAFLPFKSGRTVPGHLVLTLLLLCLMTAALAIPSHLWQSRLPKAAQRIALLEEQSLQRQLADSPSSLIAGFILFLPQFKPGAGIISNACLCASSRVYSGGTLRVEDWGMTNAVLLSSNARHVPWVPLSGSIRDILPHSHPSLVSASFDARLASIIRWPVTGSFSGNTRMPESAAWLIGLALLACGAGLLINRARISLFHRAGAYLLFLCLLAIPVWLFHIWWLNRPAPGGLIPEAHSLIRSGGFLLAGLAIFVLGFLRRKRLESGALS